MDDSIFTTERPTLFAIAYRMLGSASDAEDVLQDAWLRYRGVEPSTIRSPKALATTIVTRLCLDRLKSAQRTREDYIGPWLPEPVLTSEVTGPEVMLQRAESVMLAFLVLLEKLSPEERAALLGMSGVGKSSIANALLGEERLRTHDVRAYDSRGRHTTSGRQLLLVPGGGILIDTPGMRELQLWDVAEPVAGAFADIESIAEGCRFRDCRHAGEPDCAVAAAVAAGMLPEARLESFRKLQGEQAYQARQQDERGRIETKRLGKIGAKAMRQILRERDRRG